MKYAASEAASTFRRLFGCARSMLVAGTFAATPAAAKSIDVVANELFGIESPIYLCASTPSLVDFMASLPRRHYRELAGVLPSGCRVVEPDRVSVAVIRKLDRFGALTEAGGLELFAFVVVVVDDNGGQQTGVSFLSSDINLLPNPRLPVPPDTIPGSLREIFGE